MVKKVADEEVHTSFFWLSATQSNNGLIACDGKNDILKPGYGENVVSYSMEIYNRSGEKVFISDNIHKGWDGKLKGVLQPIALYVWFIRYKILNDPKEYFQKGTIALIY